MKKQLVLGIMSGTSIDSVDYALCQIDGRKVDMLEFWSAKFPRELQERLHTAARNGLKTYALAQVHHDLGRFYAKHAVRARSRYKPDFVAVHGQTVFHNPARKNPSALQLGEAAYLVESLRVPVISNFRAADMAAGGQGAPIATMFHQLVFAKAGKHVCVNNLGGISNVTSMDGGKGRGGRILAFDTGPANVLIDLAMRHFTDGKLHYDKNGSWAARGKPSEPLLKTWLCHKYFDATPPKSTGRELFGEPFFNEALRKMKRLSTFDVVATFTEFTARSLALNYMLHLDDVPDRLILTGGGALNPVLVESIARQFSCDCHRVEVLTSADLGWPVQAIEPAAFALLGYLRMVQRPGNIPQTTGARRVALLGQVSRY